MANRLTKHILGKQSPTKPNQLPYLHISANPDGTVRFEGPLKDRELCYKLLQGGREALDNYWAKIDAENAPPPVVVTPLGTHPALPIDVEIVKETNNADAENTQVSEG